MSASSTPDWCTSLVVHGFSLPRLAADGPRVVPTVPVVAGLLETAVGDLQFAMRIGERGEPVVLSLAAATQHVVHVRELLITRLREAGARLGEVES
jgi:hypothetical protein